MNVKSLLTVAALTLASLGVASAAKSYDFVLTSPTTAGSNQLKPGQYRVKVEGSQAVFTDENSSKQYTVPVKIEQGDRKFDHTSVQSVSSNGIDSIKVIELGGSTTKLEFGL
jgi:hypothetical protein